MSLHKPSVLNQFLRELQVSPKRYLSQNFLIDGNIINKLLQIASFKAGDFIIEIGSGPGAITEKLLKQKAHVLAIEKDPIFAQSLLRLKTKTSSLTVLEADFLMVDLIKFFPPHKKVFIISNIPFQYSSEILERLFIYSESLQSITIILQKEVAHKIVAKNSSPAYGWLSVLTQVFSTPKYFHSISPYSFYPKPKVSSAIIQMTIKQLANVHDRTSLIFFMKNLMKEKRKMLIKTLKKLYPTKPFEEIFEELQINPQARPLELTADNYLQLYKRLT